MGIYDQDLGAQLNTELPNAQVSPPATPEDHANRVSGWQAFFEKIKSDPMIQNTMIKMDTDLMQPVPLGQTPIGHLGRALSSSVDYATAVRENQRKAQMEADKAAREERDLAIREGKAPVDIEHTQAQTGQVKAATEGALDATRRANELHPVTLDDHKKRIQLIDVQLNQLRAQEKAGLMTPEHYRKKDQLENDKASAYNDMLRAHAEHYRSASDATSGKNAPKLQVTKMDDKSVVTTQERNGEIYHSIMVPPKTLDPMEARALAQQQIARGTHWFKPNDYQGTEAEAVDNLAKQYMSPQTRHFKLGQDGQLVPITKIPTGPAGGQQLSGVGAGPTNTEGFKGDAAAISPSTSSQGTPPKPTNKPIVFKRGEGGAFVSVDPNAQAKPNILAGSGSNPVPSSVREAAASLGKAQQKVVRAQEIQEQLDDLDAKAAGMSPQNRYAYRYARGYFDLQEELKQLQK